MLLGELFDVKNGVASSDLIISEDKTPLFNIPFIRPSNSWKNLVVGYLESAEIDEKFIFPKDSLIVSTNGQGSHTFSYVCPVEFVPNSDVAVLIPKRAMSKKEKMFYAMCITKNRFKFNYGRKPKGNKLENIILPVSVSDWVGEVQIPNYSIDLPFSEKHRVEAKSLVAVSDLFESYYGTNLELNSLEICDRKTEETVNFVSRTVRNNGVSALVKKIEDLEPLPAGLLTVAGGGSVLETFVQPEPFYTGRDMYYLKPKRGMTLIEKLFYAFCIRANKYRYNYNRQANKTLKDLKIPSELPEWINTAALEKQIEEATTTA
ncbi:MAG TPA: restriction endonuclease subunit S [Pyrinomonadaceae bacterium]|jgi:hypothetical protein